MTTDIPSVDDTKDQFTGNVKPGAIGAAGIFLGNSILGGTLGPIAGGTVAGAAVGGDKGQDVTISSFLLAANNMSQQSGGSSGGSSRGRM